MSSQLPNLDLGQACRGSLKGPAGDLEYRLDMPKNAARAVALICHPHPLYGGTMDNKVVYTLSRAALACDCVSLRFNFRGVGASDGPHDHGKGELEDAKFLLELLRSSHPELPVFLCGFSFGAYVALSVAAADDALAGLVTIAPPLAYAADQPVPQPQCDWLLVHGDADDVVSFEDTQSRAQGMQQPPHWVTAEGAGHFFHGQLGLLREQVEPFMHARLN